MKTPHRRPRKPSPRRRPDDLRAVWQYAVLHAVALLRGMLDLTDGDALELLRKSLPDTSRYSAPTFAAFRQWKSRYGQDEVFPPVAIVKALLHHVRAFVETTTHDPHHSPDGSAEDSATPSDL